MTRYGSSKSLELSYPQTLHNASSACVVQRQKTARFARAVLAMESDNTGDLEVEAEATFDHEIIIEGYPVEIRIVEIDPAGTAK
jgi:hypothetical protein